jgi:hypothetical protein
LHVILERAVADSGFGPVANSVAIYLANQGIAELIEDRAVDVDPLQIEAYLTRVQKCEECDLTY